MVACLHKDKDVPAGIEYYEKEWREMKWDDGLGI